MEARKSSMRWLKGVIPLLLLLATSAGADVIRQVSLPANDLVYDPLTRRIYASVPSSAGASGNSIRSFDPLPHPGPALLA
jgi:hypothetical protein